MKRIALFILTNLAVLLVLSVVLMLTGADRFITADGLNLTTLLAFSAIVGFVGSFFSLLISKPMAKWSVGARVINPQSPANETESWLVSSVHQLADRAGIGHPEVAIYDGEPNAFATGAFKNSALVAVSTGLLASMEKREVEAVLGHEVAHIANGDMVTMTLMQGVLNTFVIFISRIVGYAVDKFVFKREEEGVGMGYFITSIVCQILLGILASMILAWFSRKREFRADAGAAELLGDRQPMIDALARLGGVESGELPQNMMASGITGGRLSALFASHPPIEERIKALKSL